MVQNLFEELQERKQKLMAFANQAAEFGWIPKHRSDKSNNGSVISLEEIEEKLKKDTLVIGVIGQMKSGKSTFLNAFVFEDDVLPAATTPMTAALSVITYGEQKKVVAEFYTQDEWEEQKLQASRSLEGLCGPEESKVKAAKELVAKADKLGSSLSDFLGTTQEDSFDHLIEYVGAEGKFVSITKSVTIYYPKEYLKGVEIVDTPGFNDPVVSREERTKAFLKKADVVLMMLYAGRPFDATDRDILFKNVRQCGAGKVLVGINKYDIPYCNGEDEEQIKEYVRSEIRKASEEYNDTTLTEILDETDPIPLSAEMALLSELPMSKISATERFNFAWNRHCSNFEISAQQEMRKKSHLDDLVDAVKEMIDKEKTKILFAKPLNAIIAAGRSLKEDNDRKLTLFNDRIESLKMPDHDLEEKGENLSRANKRLNKKIESLGDDLDSELHQLTRKGKNELEDLVDGSCKKMTDIVRNEWKRWKSFKSIEARIQDEFQTLVTRKLKRAIENIADEGKRKMKRCLSDAFDGIDDVLMRFLPDIDSQSIIKEAEKDIRLAIEDNGLFSYQVDADENVEYGLGEAVYDLFNGASLGALKTLGNLLSHQDNVNGVEKIIREIKSEFDPDPYLETAFHSKDKIIEKVKKTFITNLIEPLQEQIQEIREQKGDKEKQLDEAERKLEELKSAKEAIVSQLGKMEEIKTFL